MVGSARQSPARSPLLHSRTRGADVFEGRTESPSKHELIQVSAAGVGLEPGQQNFGEPLCLADLPRGGCRCRWSRPSRTGLGARAAATTSIAPAPPGAGCAGWCWRAILRRLRGAAEQYRWSPAVLSAMACTPWARNFSCCNLPRAYGRLLLPSCGERPPASACSTYLSRSSPSP